MKKVTYEELPGDIKRQWKPESVDKVFIQDTTGGHLEYVIVPKEANKPVEWWLQRKNTSWGNPNLEPEEWLYGGHYGVGRPPWTKV